MKLAFFPSPAHLRKWLEKNHESAAELWLGYFKKDTGKASVTWPESVDEALCVGWIDGVRKGVDEESYAIRFTPRRPGSIWSEINIRRVQALDAEGRMRPAGKKAFQARTENKSGIYSYEQRQAGLDEPYAGALRKNRAASKFFNGQAASYRKAACWWVVSAKKEETRWKRLEKLVEHSSREERIPQFRRKGRA